MNLAQISNIDSQSAYAKGALAIMLENSPILRFFDSRSAFELDSTDYDHDVVEETSDFQSRAVGGGYTGAAVTPSSEKVLGSLKFHGDSVLIDRSHLADQELGLRDVEKTLLKKLPRRLRDFAIKLDNAIMNGEGTGNLLKGLSKKLNGTDDIPGFTGIKGVKNAKDYDSGVSFDLSSTSKYAKFLEALNDMIAQVPNASGILCNRDFISRLQTIAYKEKGVVDTLDQYGRPLQFYKNIPLIQMNAGVITNTEPDDTPTTPLTNTTSIYILRPRELDLSIVTNSGLEFLDYDAQASGKQSEGYNWEVRLNTKIELSDSILRVRNIKL